MTSTITPHPTELTGAGGIRLAADEWGTGPPVVLLHGGGQTRHSWRATARALAASGHRALAIDLRGHGDSDWSPDGGYGPAVHAGDVRQVVAALDEPPALVGASLGGLAAMIALADSPGGGVGTARCLVLVDVTPRLEPVGVSRIQDFMRAAPDGFATLAQAADAVAAYLPGRPRPTSNAGLARNLKRSADGRYRWHWDPRMLAELGTADPDGRLATLSAKARAVRVPTLLVRGGRSDVVSDEGARELLDLIPQARIAEVSAAGHMVAGDDNDTFTAAIVRFVTALPG